LLALASEAKLSKVARKAIAAASGTISAEDFQRLLALARLCPFGQKDEALLRVMCVYHLLLQSLYVDWADRERQRCSYFVAIKLDRRIANTHALFAEQATQSDEESLPPSS